VFLSVPIFVGCTVWLRTDQLFAYVGCCSCHFHKERENFLVCLVKLKTPRAATFLLEKMKDLKLVSLEGLEAHFYRKDPDFQQVVLNKKLVVEVGFGPEMEEFWRVRAVCEQSSAKLVALATSSSSSPSSGALLSARLATPSSAPKRKLPITAAESFQSLCSRSSNSAKRVKQVDALSGSSTSTKDMCQGDDASDSDEDDNEDDLLAAMEELNSEKGDRGEDSFSVNEGCNKKGAMDLSSCSRERLETLVRGFRGLYNKQLGANKRLEEEYLDAEKRCKAAEGLACAAKDKASMTRSHLFMLVSELKNTKSASVSVHTFRENNMVYKTYKGNVVDQQHSSSEGGAQQAPPNSKYIKGFYSKPRS